MAPYVYEPLPSPSPGNAEHDIHIRLVKLPPGEKTGEVSCEIISCPLSDPVEYEAISYSWGHPSEKTNITCDGKTILIPNNLNDFLLRTRALGRTRILWIDSVSINQNDDVEKSSQVAAMRHIYEKSKRALIWLGKEYENSTLALETAEDFCEKYKVIINNNTNATQAEKKKRPWYRSRLYEEIISVWDPKWAAFFSLFDRPYWSRAWIVQEVVVSKDQWVICGDKSIPWSTLYYGFIYCFTVETWVIEFYGSMNISNLMNMQMSQAEVLRAVTPLHYRVLLRHRTSEATDARDKVFAYHGIGANRSFNEHEIKPDYSLTTKELYLELAYKTLSNATDLDFLDVPRVSRTDTGLPSWVPYWEQETKHIMFSLLALEYMPGLAAAPEDRQHATKDSKYTPSFDDNDKTRLKLSGYVVDEVKTLTNYWDVPDTTGYSSLLRQAQVLQKNQAMVDEFELVLGMESKVRYPTVQEREEVFWQTCVVGDYPVSKEDTKLQWDNFQKRQYWLRWISRLHLQRFILIWLLPVVIGHILRAFGIPNPEIGFRASTERLINRKAMATRDGYVGLAPLIAEVGDVIALAEGGKLPLLLRKKGDDWEFIGDCYVHGYMRGERWEKAMQEETKRKEIVLV